MWIKMGKKCNYYTYLKAKGYIFRPIYAQEWNHSIKSPFEKDNKSLTSTNQSHICTTVAHGAGNNLVAGRALW